MDDFEETSNGVNGVNGVEDEEMDVKEDDEKEE